MKPKQLSSIFVLLRGFVLVCSLSLITVAPAAANGGRISLDIDGDGETSALTDGVLLLRGLFGFQGETLVANAVSENAVYSSPIEIEQRIASLREYLDVDSDGRVTGLTDGLMILRSLFGFEGESLIKGVLSSNSQRKDPVQLSNFIADLNEGYYLERDLVRLPQPDLSALTYGSPTVYLMEPKGFSEDGALLLVRTTFLDDGDASVVLRYSLDLWDVNEEEYLTNIAVDAFGSAAAREYDLRDGVIVGVKDSYSVFAKARSKSGGEEVIVRLQDGELVSGNVLADFLGLPNQSVVDRFKVSSDSNVLVLETSDSIFAPEASPDTNDTSDIYVLDLNNGIAHRVCELAGAETYSPCHLQSFSIAENQFEVAFVSTSAFVSPSKVDTNSTDTSSPEIDRADLYVWRKSINGSGSSAGTFTLISKDFEEFASGGVDYEDAALIAGEKVFFSSSSNQIETSDSNDEVDGFVYEDGSVANVGAGILSELSQGGRFAGADSSGRYILLLTSSPELSTNQTQQLIRIDREEQGFVIVSANPYLSDGWVINGSSSEMGGRVAFTANSSNLVSGALVTVSGDLYVKVYF